MASARASQPCLAYNSVNNAVWLKIPKAAAAAHTVRELGLGHPKDRLGNVSGRSLGICSTYVSLVAWGSYVSERG